MESRIYADNTRVCLYEEKDGRKLRAKEYLLESCIGTGASCVAYKAIGEDDIPVKLKQFRPEGMSKKDRLYQAAEKRFIQAYQQQISMMRDEKTAAVTTGLYGLYHDEQGFLWTSVSAMVGRTLDTLLQENSLNNNLKILRNLAESIKAYHEAGWLLLDVKPENVLVIDSLGLHGINFFDFDSFIQIEELKRAINTGEKLMLSASEAYSAPELLEPEVNLREIGITVDFYSIGAILYTAVLGKRPDIYDCLPDTEFDFTTTRESKREELSIEVQNALIGFFRHTLTMSPGGRYKTDDELIKAVVGLLQLADVSKPRLSRGIPHALCSFVGREKERKELAEAIRSSAAPLYVSGMGGIGKTQLLLKTAEDLREEYDFYFVSYKGSVRETVLSLPIENIIMEYKVETGLVNRIPNDERYRNIITCLKDSYRENSVLIIDNFDAPNDEDSPSLRYDPDLADLETLPMRVIFTTRCRFENVRNFSVGILDEKAVIRLLSDAFPLDHEKTLLGIADAVNCHTLTLSIIAGSAKESKGKLNAKKVLRELLSETENEGITNSVLRNLRSIFKAYNMSEIAQRLMACASLFPQGGISSDILVQLLSQERWSAASQLERSGWLRFDRYSCVWMIHPLVRAVCSGESGTSPEWKNVSDFVKRLRELDKAGTFKTLDAEKRAQLNELFSNIGRIEQEPIPEGPERGRGKEKKPGLALVLIILLAVASAWFFWNVKHLSGFAGTGFNPSQTPVTVSSPFLSPEPGESMTLTEKTENSILPEQAEEPEETVPGNFQLPVNSDISGQEDFSESTETVIKAGDNLFFGSYEQDNNRSNGKEEIEWTVLAIEEDSALIVSKYALDAQPFNSSSSSITWENCSLRTWLNGTFFDEAFSAEERGNIILSDIKNYGNYHYNGADTADTSDKLFLLSLEEVEHYLPSEKERQCIPTQYCRARGAAVISGNCDWWLRTKGGFSGGIAYVKNTGIIEYEGNYATHTDNAVRPAMWINLTAVSSPTWGAWSSWSTTQAYATDTRQVQVRTVETGYNMVHYGTQTDNSPHYRMFRNYSIQANLGDYNASASYGEKYFTRYVTPEMLAYATTYEPGEYIEGEYSGYQKGTTTAYSFGDDKYVWFIESPVTRTEYRFRDLDK